MNISELRDLSAEDLRNKEKALREDLFKLKFKHGIRQLENPARLSQLRKEIARVKTVIVEKTSN